MIDSLSHFLHIRILTSWHWLVRHAWASSKVVRTALAVAAHTLRISSDNIGPVLLIVVVIGEEETLSVDNSFNYFSGLFSLIAQSFDDDFHHFRNHSGETLENLVDNTACHLLKH